MSGWMLFLVALTLLSVVAALISFGSLQRIRKDRMDPMEQDRTKTHQLQLLREELAAMKKTCSRKKEIADQLPSIAKTFTERLPEASYPPILVRSAKELFDADKVGFFSPMNDSSDYTLEVGTGFPADWQGRIRIASDEGLLGIAIQKKIVVSRIDPLSSCGLRTSSRSLEQAGIPPDFAAPVFGISGIIGVLVVTGCPYPLEEERKYVSMLADLFSAAMQKARLIDASRTGAWKDDLTGLSTRLHFLQRFESEIRRTGNYQQSFALFMFDIDEFKRINDTYGHAAGDHVLKTVAEITRQNTRSADLVGRFGGDEFLVLIGSATEEQSLRYAENIRNTIAAAELKIAGFDAPIRMTISGGLSFYPAHGQSTSEMMHAADQALYEAKRKGRNRTVIADIPLLGGSPDPGSGGPSPS
jgi:diguanylate cyclase (GGDEF)-like protein